MLCQIMLNAGRLGLARSSPLSILGRTTTTSRSLHIQRPLLAAVEVPPVVVAPPRRRPIGAVRGTLFGFLLGATSAGVALYYYVIDDYRLSNLMLTEDLTALQNAVTRLQDYVTRVEGTVQELEKRLR